MLCLSTFTYNLVTFFVYAAKYYEYSITLKFIPISLMSNNTPGEHSVIQRIQHKLEDILLPLLREEANSEQTRKVVKTLATQLAANEQHIELLKQTILEQEKQLHYTASLYMHAPASHILINGNGIIINCNLAAQQLLGKEKRALSGRIFHFFLPAAERQAFREFINAAIHRSETQYQYFNIKAQQKEQLIKAYMACKVIPDALPGETHLSLVLVDLTQHLISQETLQQEQLSIEKLKAITATQEEERSRIAESLHNELGQTLYGAHLSLERQTNLDAYNAEIKNETVNILRTALTQTRTLAFELAPPILEGYGLKATIEDLLIRNKQQGLNITSKISNYTRRLPPAIEITVFRIVQELYTNVTKHARATEAGIQLSITKKNVEVTVIDNGIGMNTTIIDDQKAGFGLKNICSRTKLMDGKISIHSAPGKGTKVIVTIPLNQAGH